MPKKKVLLITYYWPPAGGAGVQRWLKMSKYLANSFDLTVYHPQNADYPATDESLLAEIPQNATFISKKIQEPYALAAKLNPKNKNYQKGQIEAAENQSALSKLSLWIRANYFIPDARAWWIMPSFRYLNSYLKTHPQDVIISTGPPHSVHVIALRLKLRNPQLNWVADFRDPWTEIDYFDKLPLQKSAHKKHQKLEKEVLKYADLITTVSENWAENLALTAKKDVEVIYNGFDQEDFRKKIQPDDKFVITYTGSLNDDRNPSVLWQTLNEMCARDEFAKNLELRLIGQISGHVKAEIEQFPLLHSKTVFSPYIPHRESIEALQKSHVLLLLINDTSNAKGIIPGKLFEYLAANRRILCLGSPEADIARIIHETHAGVVLNREDSNTMRETLHNWFRAYQQKTLNQSAFQNIGKYSRKNAAMEFIQLIENI